MTQKKTNINPYSEEDEIDLVALAKKLWEERKKVIKIILVFMGIGLFVAIFSQKEYTASTTMLPQANKGIKIGGNLGGLAAMAGINLGSMGGDSGISPAIYPQIINSIPFQKELLQTPLTIMGQNQQITFQDYYTNIYSPSLLGYLKKFTIGLPSLVTKNLKGKSSNMMSLNTDNQLLRITEDEKELMELLREQIVLDVNNKEGYVTLSVNMPEALAAAELTKKAEELLQEYIINFKIQKSKEQLKFIQERYIEKEQEFKSTQQKLARFRDRNQNVTTALAQTTLAALQSENDLAYGIYAELAKQLEAQQIQVKEDTPVFTVIKPASVPFEKSKPKRLIILAVWTILGGFFGVGRIFVQEFVESVKSSRNEL